MGSTIYIAKKDKPMPEKDDNILYNFKYYEKKDYILGNKK